MANEGQGRRLGKRDPVLIHARIIDRAGYVTDVWLRDLSSTGARLETPPFVDIPKRFTLRYFLNEKREAEAEVVWWRGVDIGARFVTGEESIKSPKPDAVPTRRKMSLAELRGLTRGARR
jgi:hypothetical protein